MESLIYNFLVEYYVMRHSTAVGKDKSLMKDLA